MNTKYKYALKTAAYTLASSFVLYAPATFATVSQAPLTLTEGVAPNLVFTLDDSTSMAYAYAPDSLGSSSSTLRFRASNFNPMYYNPNVNYKIPKSFDIDGNEITLSTSFDAAYYDGYRKASGSRNLNNSYSVTTSQEIPNGNNNTASEPSMPTCTTGQMSSTGSSTCSIRGVTYSVTRNNSTCTITTPANSGVTCSLNGRSSDTNRNATVSFVAGAYYTVYDPDICTVNNKEDNDNCYRVVKVTANSGNPNRIGGDGSADERQNFANWYSFYRTRALATRSATTLAFYDLSPATRFTWQSLIHCRTLNYTAATSNTGGNTDNGTRCGFNKFGEFNTDHRANFIYWLHYHTYFNDGRGTPLRLALRRAGDFYTTATPWHRYPNTALSGVNTTDNTYSCRSAYHVVMTDGMWNTGVNSLVDNPAQPSRHDNANFDLPDGKAYTANRRPYGDSTTQTLADYAMHYWATDLRSTLKNGNKPYIQFKDSNPDIQYWDSRNNPATWQHMVNYMMGLGLTRSLNNTNIPWQGETHSGTGYTNLKNNTNWPAAATNSNNNVYDLWHAAINSRGEFFSVDTPEAMVDAFTKILSNIAERKSIASRPAVTSGLVELEHDDQDTKTKYIRHFFQASYDSSANWSGDLVKFSRTFNEQTNTYEIKDVWSAQRKLDAKNYLNRNIKISGSGTSKLKNFTWDNAGNKNTEGTLAFYLSKSPEAVADDGLQGPKRLNYLRGDRSNEGSAMGKFRQRSSVLGDFVSSAPAVVQGPRYRETFVNILENNTHYTKYMSDLKNRAPRIYIGSNDGMLHGFDGETGEETFAFIPTAVFPKLNLLTAQTYKHQFYVEGSPVVNDVYDPDTSSWRTVLVGTLRAGGRSLFALDVTTPGQEKLLWELDDDHPDLQPTSSGQTKVKPGYSFSKPTIARLHNGRWAVVTGNGYEAPNHTNGKAALYVIDAIKGNLISLEVQGRNNEPNGLSTPKLADNDGDGIADYAYAGDLQGNIWRFDLYGSKALTNGADSIYGNKKDTAAFAVSYGAKPLFSIPKGTSTRSITAPPSIVRHPTNKGYIIVVGTGKYFEDQDNQPDISAANSLYGIWDEETLGTRISAPNGAARVVANANNTLIQEITNQTTGAINAEGEDERAIRYITQNKPDWTVHKLWRLDLRVKGQALDGEMMIEDMTSVGQTLFFQALAPNKDPCSSGNVTWSYAINPHSGARTLHRVFDHRQYQNNLPSREIVSGIGQPGEGGFTISATAPGQFELCTGLECVTIYSGSDQGRQSWRLVPAP